MPKIRSEYSEKSPYFLPKHKCLETHYFVLSYDYYKAGKSKYDRFCTSCIENAAREVFPEDPETFLAAVTNENITTIPGMSSSEYNETRRIFYCLVYKKRYLSN